MDPGPAPPLRLRRVGQLLGRRASGRGPDRGGPRGHEGRAAGAAAPAPRPAAARGTPCRAAAAVVGAGGGAGPRARPRSWTRRRWRSSRPSGATGSRWRGPKAWRPSSWRATAPSATSPRSGRGPWPSSRWRTAWARTRPERYGPGFLRVVAEETARGRPRVSAPAVRPAAVGARGHRQEVRPVRGPARHHACPSRRASSSASWGRAAAARPRSCGSSRGSSGRTRAS